jgi:NAD(P)H-dependent FMN reductase
MKSQPKRIVALSGSTRKFSTGTNLIHAIAELFPTQLQIEIFEGLTTLPHFNPDEDTDHESAPGQVKNFRQLLRNADGILICTPEYAHGVVGTLKNAIDWTVSSCEFSHKPTVLITASTDGQIAHKALLETLKVIEAKDIEEYQLLIQFAKTKISRDNKITDEKTLAEIKTLISNFIQSLSA